MPGINGEMEHRFEEEPGEILDSTSFYRTVS